MKLIDDLNHVAGCLQPLCRRAAAELSTLQSRLDDSLRLNSQAANEIGELKQRLEKAEAMCVVKDDALQKGLTWDSHRNVIYYAQLNETFRSAISTTCGEELLSERNHYKKRFFDLYKAHGGILDKPAFYDREESLSKANQ